MNTWGVVALASLCLAGCSREAARANVLLISIDTLRADHLGVYGYPRATSPNLDRLGREGLVFENASTPRAKTTPAIASLFSSAYPHEHCVRDLLQPIDRHVPLLAQAFAEAGYQSAAIVGNFVLKDQYCGFARGFDRYIESLPSRQGVPPDDVPQRTAHSLTSAALAALGLEAAPALDEDGKAFEPAGALFDATRPWFLWLHYMDPHGAYEPPQEQRVFQRETPRWIDPPPANSKSRMRVSQYNVPASARDAEGRFDAAAVIDLYDAEIRYADSEIGKLIDKLRARGDLKKTWVIVVADHGESLGEQDYWFEHGFYAYESTCRVPLIVRPPDDWPDRPAPGRRAGAISLADMSLTIRVWLDLPFGGYVDPGSPISGDSRAGLLARDDPEPFATYSEKIEGEELFGTVQIKAVRFAGWKLLRRWAHAAGKQPGEPKVLKLLGEELYDLRVDPLETRDLSKAPPAEAPLDLLRLKLLEFAAADAPFEELEQTLARRRAALEARDAEAIRALKALGY
ncbi:MAG: sulfatase [Planctomycetota bacterium]